MDTKTLTRVFFAATGVLAGLVLAKMLNVQSLASKIGLGNSAAA